MELGSDLKGANTYKKIINRKLLFVALLLIGCIITLIIDILVGPAWLKMSDVLGAIFKLNSTDPASQVIVWTMRFPMALMAIVVGATLGIAGAEMQTILDNPLASPYTLGVSSGAGFGAALIIVFGSGIISYCGEYVVSISSFIFALLTCFIIYFIGKVRQVTSATMILAGIGLMFLFQALLSLLQYLATTESLQTIVFWLFGSLMKTTWTKLGIVTAVFIIVVPFFIKDAWKLTALKLGDDKAKNLGINVERLRLKTFILISILTASAVCFAGTIGFIGLVGPHIARILVGEDQRYFLPVSALGGAFLLSMGSILSKVIIPGAIFPIGIVTSLIGVPFFFSLILSKKRGNH